MLTKALARENADRRILVNAIAPGPVLTPLLEDSSEHADGSALASEALVGDAGSFFVGQIISTNGGAVI